MLLNKLSLITHLSFANLLTDFSALDVLVLLNVSWGRKLPFLVIRPSFGFSNFDLRCYSTQDDDLILLLLNQFLHRFTPDVTVW